MSKYYEIHNIAQKAVLDLLMEHMEWQDQPNDPEHLEWRSPETIWEELMEAVNLLRRIEGKDEIDP